MATKPTDTASTDPRLHAEAAGFRSGVIPIETPKFDPIAVLREEYERLAASETKEAISFDKMLDDLRSAVPADCGPPVVVLVEDEYRHLARCVIHSINQTTWERRARECEIRCRHEHQGWALALKDRLGKSLDNMILDPMHAVLCEYKSQEHPITAALRAILERK